MAKVFSIVTSSRPEKGLCSLRAKVFSWVQVIALRKVLSLTIIEICSIPNLRAQH